MPLTGMLSGHYCHEFKSRRLFEDVQVEEFPSLYDFFQERGYECHLIWDWAWSKMLMGELDCLEMSRSLQSTVWTLQPIQESESQMKSREEYSMKRVITYGTFDLLHYGHINLLRRAKAYGDYLIVALSTDEFNWNEKQKKCYFSYEQRKALLESIRYVDLVIPETSWDQKRSDMHEYHIDTFVMGDDWEGKFDFLKEEGVEVVYLPRTPEISTTQIKRDLNGNKESA